ncbi:unnamed protein product, partial [Rotaria magnacalcarata]
GGAGGKAGDQSLFEANRNY